MKFLAIDIGTAQIKCVIAESKLGRFDISYQTVFPVSDALEIQENADVWHLSLGQRAALTEIRQKLMPMADRLVTNLPYSLYGSRYMSFPFKDKKKLLSAVRFAVEDEIPFDLDDCVLASQIFPTKSKETHVLTGFAPLGPLGNFLDQLKELDLQPDSVAMDHSALSSLLIRQKGPPEAALAVFNLGHRKSSFTVFRNNIPVIHRTTMIGGFHLTKAIAEKYQMSMSEAEGVKLERSFFASPDMQLNADQQIFSEMIKGVFDPAFSDVQQTLMAYVSRYNESVDNIQLCGGSSLIPGLADYLSSSWSKRVQHFQFSQRFPSLTIRPSRASEAALPVAAALGLSQLPGEARSTINFRSGKLRANHRQLNLNLKQFVYPAKLLSAVYVVAFLSLLGQMFLLNREISIHNGHLDQAIQGIFGKSSPSYLATLKSSPEKLKSSVEKKIQEFAVDSENAPASDMLETILAMSTAVPKSTPMEIRQLQLNAAQLSLTAESPSQGDAENALTLLSKLPKFQNPKSGPIESKGARKRFSLQLQRGK